MEIQVLFDKYAVEPRFTIGWGVSFLINKTVLFDTGEKGDMLLHNMDEMGVDVKRIEAVVISHDHWDHTGGLWDLLKRNPSLNVYACPGFGSAFKEHVRGCGAKLLPAERFTEIADRVFISGEIVGTYKEASISEQALAIKHETGLTILTGCAHPGIGRMIRETAGHFPDTPLALVAGGFHLLQESRGTIEPVVEEFRELGVRRVGPTHCSGDDAAEIFKQRYGADFMPIIVGDRIMSD
jgi:7,8-dihydropterin-6-yl-methyl-4-(beta-D-ribofuranosyl)aminobenzene 5'-phosphate synthase